MFFNPVYLIFISPALVLMLWAQWRVKSAYHRGMQVSAELSGAAAARYILDNAGCHDVGIVATHGWLSDHYDPSSRTLRLSQEVYESHSATAVGIAAHEAGHALQHAEHYSPLIVRNAAVPAAQAGPMASMILLTIGAIMGSPKLIVLGLLAFSMILFFQLVNLPVEFDASNRAKRLLGQLEIIDGEGAIAVRDVLNAAGWTYVAAMVQSVLTLLYYLFQFSGILNRQDD